MTIEGRPELNVDWDAQYRKERRNRLDDTLAEYLNDDTKTDPRQCYEEVLASAQEWINHHKKHMDRWVEFKSLMMGHRPMDPVFLTEDRNSNFPKENTLYEDVLKYDY